VVGEGEPRRERRGEEAPAGDTTLNTQHGRWRCVDAAYSPIRFSLAFCWSA
jgi:hypothetical protein